MPPRRKAARSRRAGNPAPAVAPPQPVVLGPRTRFLGSTASVVLEQGAADIYLQDHWTTVGTLLRVAVHCVVWGISFASVERATRTNAGAEPSEWELQGGFHTGRIDVEDRGQQLIDRVDVPLHPNAAFIPPSGVVTAYEVGGALRSGFAIPWHHSVALKPSRPTDAFHWHQHDRRKGKEIPPIKSKEQGKHWIFTELLYSTQVQNCRRAKGE